MNLYFRLFAMLFWRARRASKIGFLDTSKVSYRALPSDCDINMHMTNSRYSAFMDLARTYMMGQMDLLTDFIKRGWMPIVNASEFTYIRDIKPLQKFEIETRVVGWDEKYFYIEHRFVSHRGLHAIAHVRGVFVCKGKQVDINKVVSTAGFEGTPPELPESVVIWKSLLEAKKSANAKLKLAA